jgi:Protein HRI1
VTLPRELIGAWRRSGLLLDGVRVVDYCDVMWLQTPEWFVDIRVLIDPEVIIPTEGVPNFLYREIAFAGTTAWDAPRITWSHLIDSILEPAIDSSSLVWADGVVLENGSAPVDDQMIPFTEEWLRMTGDEVTWQAENADNRARIEVGRFAVEIEDNRPNGSFRAVRYSRDVDRWTEFARVTA